MMALQLRCKGIKLRAKKSPRLSSIGVRRYASVTKYQKDNVIEGFTVKEVREISEFKLTGVKLVHNLTGAQHLHIDKEDQNNVFSIGFQTLPNDSSGVAHILEHTTLCGSEKYPVRDPFFKMLNRSLATYMNAWTAHDFTNYPFSTQNLVDFENLLNVYLDATLRPRLLLTDFLQEGWRVEHTDPEDKNSPLKLTGVVYNEMKGALSDASSIFYTKHQEALYEGTTYENCSGGDPMSIPTLTHEALREFHRLHYLPENARSYSYGNFPLENHLKTLNEKYNQVLSQRTVREIDPLKGQKTSPVWEGPRRFVVDGPCDTMSPVDSQFKITISYVTNEMKNTFESLSLNLLGSLLTSGASAPMQIALLDTNLGAEYSPTTGYNSHAKHSSFSIGLQGVKESDIPEIESRIEKVLAEVKSNGFSDRHIESVLQPIELSMKQRSANFGININQSLMTSWMYENNPLDSLEVAKNLKRLRTEISKGRFFESLVDKYFIKNSQKMTFIMRPDEKFEEKLIQQEKALTETTISKLKQEQDFSQYLKNCEELRERQDAKEDLSCLPTLSLDDIPKQALWHEISQDTIDNVPIFWRETDTNGISYFRMIFQSDNLPTHLRSLVPLFCDCLTYLGTKQRSMAEIDQDIHLKTGGISFSSYLRNSLDSIHDFEEGISVSSKCLDFKITDMYELIRELILETDFDNLSRLQTLIIGNSSYLKNSIADSGHAFAKNHAASCLTLPMAVSETYSGLNQVFYMNDLSNLKDLKNLSEQLKELQSIFRSRQSLKALIISEKESQTVHFDQLKRLFDGFSRENFSSKQSDSLVLPSSRNHLFEFPFSSYYSGLSINSVPYNDLSGPHLQILSSLVSNLYLHREIREKGGAYGGGAMFNSLSGQFSFYSYRDPVPLKNVNETFWDSLKWATTHDFTSTDIKEAKLSLFQSIDKPRAASEEGLTQFTMGLSREAVQSRRETFLSTTASDIQRVARELLDKPQFAATIIGSASVASQLKDCQDWVVRSTKL